MSDEEESASRVAVIGAGAFGGWTALHLARRGAEVTLVDAWGAGNARASSGGETRVIRGVYGPDAVYVDWVARAFELWERFERARGVPLYTPTGALWMCRTDDAYVRASAPLLREVGLAVEPLPVDEARVHFPEIAFDGVASVWLERRAGFLAAREACRQVRRAVLEAGGRFVRARARPGPVHGGRLERVELADGSTLAADRYVFACGPWLGELFPELLGEALVTSRQEVHYFGTPAGDDAFEPGRFPVWVDFGERVFYGIPGNDGRGFKVADDTHGEPVDATTLDRSTPDPEGLERVRALLAERFPRLADAPLLGSRVCQYTNTPDGHYLLDRHPEAEDLWLAGGGCGHGFKLGPALGEHVAGLALGDEEPLEPFSIERLAGPGAHGGGRSQFDAGREGGAPA